MRLTLRTLLAYLDDVLEPSHAREIGDKINESALATQLVAKIRDVIRRRRLGAPAVMGAGAGIDANLVAEYLDNTLSPEAVADVEKVCLDSDVNLAEVAACHQVLTLVLGEPVEMLSGTRERMYALGPLAESTPATAAAAAIGPLVTPPPEPPHPAPAPSPHAANGREHAPAPAASTATPVSFSSTLPDYLKPHDRLSLRGLLPVAVVAVLLVLWLGAFYYLMRYPNPPSTAATNTTSTQNVAVNNAGSAKVEPGKAKPGEKTIASNEPVKNALSPDGINPPPPPDEEPETPRKVEEPVKKGEEPARKGEEPARKGEEPMEEPVVVKTKPEKPEPEKTPSETTEPDKTTEPEKTEPVKKLEPVAVATYQSLEGVVLRLDPMQHHWYPLEHRTIVESGLVLAVPSPFEGVFQFDQRRGTVTVLENSLVRTLSKNDQAEWGWEIVRGRMTIRLSPGATQKKLALEVRGDLWGIELLTDDTLVGVEVDPREPVHFEELPSGSSYYGAIFVETGSVKITSSRRPEETLKAPGWHLLTPETPQPSGSPPWLTDKPRPRPFSAQFEKELVGSDPGEQAAADQLVGDAVKSEKPLMARYAVECLGLMGAVDQLVDALKTTRHEESRLAAIRALREWLPAVPENKDRLLAELQKRFTPEDVETLYRLLWGYSADDLRDQAVGEKLTGLLEHDEIAVRELAFYYILNYTGKRNDYRANARPSDLQETARRWKQIAAKGPLLPPLPAAPAKDKDGEDK